jgi:tetratricopeptide (TPR) repeat protein
VQLSITKDSLFDLIGKTLELKDPLVAKEALKGIETRLRSPFDEDERIYLLFSRANCFVTLRDFEQARKALDIALSARGDESSIINFEWTHAVIAHYEEKYTEALQRFSAIQAGHSRLLQSNEWRFMYEDIQTRRALLSVGLSKFEEAIPLLKESLKFELPEEELCELTARLGLCYVELEEFDAARDYLLQAIERGPSGDWKWKTHYYLGITYNGLGMLKDAKREFQNCEQLATTVSVSLLDVYGWLRFVCKALGESSESGRYAALSKRN